MEQGYFVFVFIFFFLNKKKTTAVFIWIGSVRLFQLDVENTHIVSFSGAFAFRSCYNLSAMSASSRISLGLLGPLYGISALYDDPYYAVCRWPQLSTQATLCMLALLVFMMSMGFLTVVFHKSLGKKQN